MERLPPNRRRRKVPAEQRKRVAKACNSCNVRRLKCTGEDPCKPCQSSGRTCVYPSASGEKITISRATYHDLQANENFLRACLRAALPADEQRVELMRRVRQTHASNTSQALSSENGTGVALPSSYLEDMADGGRFLTDPDGQERFIGNASGAAFLDQIREFSSTVLPVVCGKNSPLDQAQIQDSFSNLRGRYQTSDSRPLNLPVVDPYNLPPIEETQRALSLLSSSMGATDDVSILYWGPLSEIMRQVYSNREATDGFDDHRIQLATINAALALASQQSPSGALDSEIGDTYFAHARFLLGPPLDTATRMHIPCLAMMGYYLLGANRRDAAYSYIRLSGHIAVTYGYYQSWVTSEQEKRVFWTIYVLDRFLSCLLGRPAMIADEDISVGMPQEVPGLPSAIGLGLHVKLAQILGHAVEKIYGYGGRGSKHPGLAHVHHFLDELDDWRSGMPSTLSIDRCLGPEPPRDLLTLHMAYNQARILVTRQPMFSSVRQNVAQSFLPNSARLTPPDSFLLRVCTEAALENVQLINRLFEIVSSGSTVFGMIDYHTAFNAAIILELACLCRHGGASTYKTPQIGYVIDVLQHAGLNGNEFARDCSNVLADFRALRERLVQEMLRRVPANNISLSPLPSISPRPGTLPPDSSEAPAPILMDLVLEDFPSPGLDFDRVMEEFNNWLEEKPY